MGSENRRAARRQVRNGARLVSANGAALADCLMLDLSATGARLEVQAPDALPDSFTMLLSHTGSLKRQCAVVWRAENTVGVQFVPDPVPAKRRYLK